MVSGMTLVDRRAVLGYLAATPVLAACGRDPASSPDAGPEVPAPDALGDVAWASGGTVAMTDKASYPDPFTGAVASCVLVASTTDGPCTTEDPPVREDVSEGWTGLPVRLALKVLDVGCAPVAGATVTIWHTNLAGVYSGDTPNHALCSSDDAAAIAARYMRGVQTTGADGTVSFDTCFPGWYGGRAIHIHFQVASGATTYKISQLFFPEDVTAQIFASHPEYQPYGPPDTTFADDGVLAAVAVAERARLVLGVARMTDGAMLASKVVTVTS